jgi:hypothetical protein
MLSQKSKIQNSLFMISMKSLETFISITNDGIFTKRNILRKKAHVEAMVKVSSNFGH